MISQLNEFTGIVEQLIDARNIEVLEIALARIESTKNPLIGFDIETHDADRHEGLNKFMNIDPKSEKYKSAKKLVFDVNRTTVTGFSFYVKGEGVVYYVNHKHADVENQIGLAKVTESVKRLRDAGTLVIHNYPFENTMCDKYFGVDLGKNYIDTLQMCVSAYNADTYDIEKFKASDLGGMVTLLPRIKKQFSGYVSGQKLTSQQFEVLNQVVSITSRAEHSYNGYVYNLSYGYALKKITSGIFNYKQTEFKDSLLGRAHMGLVTGEEILHYGADDAYWCVRLFDWLLDFMQKNNPQVINTFFTQENPMAYIFADSWKRGWRVNLPAIEVRNEAERFNYTCAIRDLCDALKSFRFGSGPSVKMIQDPKQAKWYLGKEGDAYITHRKKITNMLEGYNELLEEYGTEYFDDAALARDDIALRLASLTSGSVINNWLVDEEVIRKKADLDLVFNPSYYMGIRVLLHDLCLLPFVHIKGEIKTDVEARGKMKETALRLSEEPELWLKYWKRYNEYQGMETLVRQSLAEHVSASYNNELVCRVLDCLNNIAGIDQRIKLFVNSYRLLTDPETKRMYPIVSSKLNTRRMAAQNPNTMQLGKSGESTYVRGFFLPHNEEHLLIAVDWSQVELVLIGEASHDPKFFEAYGQKPYQDLHRGAAVSALKVNYPNFTEQVLLDINNGNEDVITHAKANYHKIFIDPVKNKELKPYEVMKFWRGSAGKPSNFGYWYSGSLMTIQDKLNWTMDEVWAGTDNYRSTFKVAENWRLETIQEINNNGAVRIFDGHTRVRYEGTMDWYFAFTSKWDAYGDSDISNFGHLAAKKIQRRSGNQAVNAKIQGGCATLTKRSILKLDAIINAVNSKWDAFFIMPIHDELVFSVHHSQAIEFSQIILDVMCDHPDLVNWLKLDGTISMGATLEPYHPVKAPYGQIELDEAPRLEGVLEDSTVGTLLSKEDRLKVVDYLMAGREEIEGV